MREDDILIGVLAQNGVPCPVYLNPETMEVFYIDEEELPYLLSGVDVTSDANPGIGEDYEALLDDVDDSIIGVIIDGNKRWLLTEEKAFLCEEGALEISGATASFEWDGCVEYEGDGEEE